MNRNYDEIIAEMLIQVDKHSEELTKQSAEQTRQSLRAEESHKALVQELKEFRDTTATEFRQIRHDFIEADTQLSAQLVHSATILDRIIKRNNLDL